LMIDGIVKCSTSALRCIPRSLRRTIVRLVPRNLRALNLKPFTLPSDTDFFRVRQDYILLAD
jgi:hypothetical protein